MKKFTLLFAMLTGMVGSVWAADVDVPTSKVSTLGGKSYQIYYVFSNAVLPVVLDGNNVKCSSSETATPAIFRFSEADANNEYTISCDVSGTTKYWQYDLTSGLSTKASKVQVYASTNTSDNYWLVMYSGTNYRAILGNGNNASLNYNTRTNKISIGQAAKGSWNSEIRLVEVIESEIKVSQLTDKTQATLSAGQTLIVDEDAALSTLSGTGSVSLTEAHTLTISDATGFDGNITVNNSSADATVAGNLTNITLECIAGTLKYSGTNISNCYLDGVILTGNNYITVSNTNTIKNLAGNDLTSGGSYNYAFIGSGTLNFAGTCDLTKTSTGAVQNVANKIGMGSGNSIVIKSGGNLTANYIMNTTTSNNNASITVEDNATLTAQDVQTTTLTCSGNVTFNGTTKFWTALYSKYGTINLNGLSNTAARIELSDNYSAETTTLNINQGSTLTITGNSDVSSYKNASIILGEWNAKTIVNANGWLVAESASIQPGDTGFDLNIGANGGINVKGIGIVATAKSGKTQAMAINLTEGGELKLGSTGMVFSDAKPIAYTTTITRSTEANKYGTICVPANATVTGATILACAGKSNNGAVFEYATGETDEESNSLVAGVPYLYRATAGSQTFMVNGNYANVADAQGGAFTGSYVEQELTDGNCILYQDEFRTVSGDGIFVGANKAYITAWDALNEYEPADGRKTFVLGVTDNGATGIATIDTTTATMNNGKFVEDGRIVIVKNGQKYNTAGQFIK